MSSRLSIGARYSCADGSQVNKVSRQTGLYERNYTGIAGVIIGHKPAADCRLDKASLC